MMATSVHKTWSGLQSLRAKKHSGGAAKHYALTGQKQNSQLDITLPPVLSSVNQKPTELNCKSPTSYENSKLSTELTMNSLVTRGFQSWQSKNNPTDVGLRETYRYEGSSLPTQDGVLMEKRNKEIRGGDLHKTLVPLSSVPPAPVAPESIAPIYAVPASVAEDFAVSAPLGAEPKRSGPNIARQSSSDVILAASGSGSGNEVTSKQEKMETNASAKEKKAKTVQDQQTEASTHLDSLETVYKKTSSMVKCDEEGDYTKEFREQLLAIRQSYFLFNFEVSLAMASRRKAGQLLADTGSVRVLCEVVADGLQWRKYVTEQGSSVQKWWKPLYNAFTSVFNFMDCCPEVSFVVRDHAHLMSTILQKLKEWHQPHMEDSLIKQENQLLTYLLGSVHNMAMYQENVSRLQELHTFDVLIPYLSSPSDRFKLSAIAAMADIATEAEADQLATSPDLVQFLLERLKNALVSKNRRHDGWTVAEIIKTIRQLARNDANKRLLVKEGVLPLLVQGLKSAYKNEQEISCETIWVLTFDKENIPEILKEEDLLDHVVAFYKEGASSKICLKASQGILWQIRYDLAKNQKHACVGEEFLQKVSRVEGQSGPASVAVAGNALVALGHVMISYQWADQQVVVKVRDQLRSHGMKVWMDIDDMGGSTLQAMAEAVERAFVIICCMSQKYKDSPNCRAEAEYAFQKHKVIIPLLMERGYKPDGWLGMILGAKLFYDFSGKYSFESRMEQLIKSIQKQAGTFTEVDGPVKLKQPESARSIGLENLSSSPTSHRSASNPTKILSSDVIKKIKTWNRNDVQAWLKEHDLNGTELEFLTGKEIVFLQSLRQEAPEFFYHTLEKKLQIETLTGLISFTDALDGLSSI